MISLHVEHETLHVKYLATAVVRSFLCHRVHSYRRVMLMSLSLFVSVIISESNAERHSGVVETDGHQAGVPAFLPATQHRVSFTISCVSSGCGESCAKRLPST